MPEDGAGTSAHPRPLLRRPWTDLDGEWAFAADPDAAREHPADVDFDRRIRVPYAPETPASGIGWTGPLHRAWYRRSLPGPVDGRRTVLHLGAVDRRAEVWVGGEHVASHEGGYAPVSVDVTDALRRGTDLVVRADDDPGDLDAPRGKQDWRDEPHAVWYPRTTGIWRTVWCEQVATVRVEELHWAGDPVAMTVTVRVRLSAPARGRVALRLRAGGRLLVDDTVRIDGAEVVRTVGIGDGGVDDAEGLVWSPGRPTLLDAEVALLADDGDVLDEVRSSTALRSVGVDDGRFLLNGRPHPLRLVLDQGYWPTTGATAPDVAALRRDLELVRELGFDGVRMHQKVEDPRFLALADRLGVLVWAELPSVYRASPTSARRLLAEWGDVVRGHAGHPSVVAWVPVNESWGVPDLERDPRQRALVRALAATADALDGTRPVSANDGWETLGGDLVGVHDYTQDPAVLTARYGTRAAVAEAVAGRRADGRLGDLDRRGPAGRAVVLSEFGGIALDSAEAQADGSGDGGWGYDRADSPDDLVRRYRELWAAVRASDGLAGACWTQLTDTYQEVNGLLTADRRPKADLSALRSAVGS